MKKGLLGLLALAFVGCSETDEFNIVDQIEGLYSLNAECIEPENSVRNFEQNDWYIFEESDDLLITGAYGNFIAQREEEKITCQDFSGVNFLIDFDGTYDSGYFEGDLHRVYFGYDWETTLHLWGERELWGEPDDFFKNVEGFYLLQAEIIHQDCIKEEYQEYFFPSPYEFPIFVFQRDNALYFWGYGLRRELNVEDDGNFSERKVEETMRATLYSNFEGNISEGSLEATFDYSYDYFNTGVIKCSSEIYVSGYGIEPWNDEEHIQEVFSNHRMIFFTAQDYVFFKDDE